MKRVTFTRDMRPYHAGQSRLVPPAVAARLYAQGHVSEPEPWPARKVEEAAAVATEASADPYPAPARRYKTKAAR